MKDKLSLERLKIWVYRFHDAWNQSCEVFQEEEGKQAYSQIKSLLTPVPIERKVQFIREWRDELAMGIGVISTGDIKRLLQAWNNLREGKEK